MHIVHPRNARGNDEGYITFSGWPATGVASEVQTIAERDTIWYHDQGSRV